MDLQSLDVNELVILAKQNDDSAFFEIASRYTPLLLNLISEFKSGDACGELLNEARVGLHKAVMSYDVSLGRATFGTYARTCVHNHLLDFMSKTSSAAINSDALDVERVAVSSSIQLQLERKEALYTIKRWAEGALSDYEYRVFLLWLSGYKTAEIADQLGKTAKSIDNAKARMFNHLRDVRCAIDSILNFN